MKNFFPSRAVSCRVLFCCCSFNLMVKPYNKSFIDQACSVKMAEYWPRSFFAFLWISTSSRSIKTQKKNLANIQPSWPHAWSITHMYSTYKMWEFTRIAWMLHYTQEPWKGSLKRLNKVKVPFWQWLSWKTLYRIVYEISAKSHKTHLHFMSRAVAYKT